MQGPLEQNDIKTTLRHTHVSGESIFRLYARFVLFQQSTLANILLSSIYEYFYFYLVFSS
jgi:hypothetical protein